MRSAVLRAAIQTQSYTNGDLLQLTKILKSHCSLKTIFMLKSDGKTIT